MNANDAVDAMLTVFKTVWDAYPGSPTAVYPDNSGMPPSVDKLWARVSVQHSTGGQRSLASDTGTRRFTATGFVWVQVFAPSGDGLTGARTAAQAIVNAYRDARLAVWFHDVALIEIGGDGAFSRVDVKANFQYDDVR
jgi:hypothetical protein